MQVIRSLLHLFISAIVVWKQSMNRCGCVPIHSLHYSRRDLWLWSTLSSCSMWPLECRGLSSPSAGAQLPWACGILVPQPGIELASSALEGRLLTTREVSVFQYILSAKRSNRPDFVQGLQYANHWSWGYSGDNLAVEGTKLLCETEASQVWCFTESCTWVQNTVLRVWSFWPSGRSWGPRVKLALGQAEPFPSTETPTALFQIRPNPFTSMVPG